MLAVLSAQTGRLVWRREGQAGGNCLRGITRLPPKCQEIQLHIIGTLFILRLPPRGGTCTDCFHCRLVLLSLTPRAIAS